MRQISTENYEDDISIENELHDIRVISDDESTKDSKHMGKRYQTSVSKAKVKETNDLECLTSHIKSLATKIIELEKRKSENSVSRNPPKFLFKGNSASSSSNNYSTKFVQSSNVVLNIEKIDTDSYCTFHNDHH